MIKANVPMDPKKVIFPGQPIQWHLPTTRHDRCPRCGAGLGYLGRERRACMGPIGPTVGQEALLTKPDAYYAVHGTCPPGTVWECMLSPEGFLQRMRQDSEAAVPLKPRKPYTRKAPR